MVEVGSNDPVERRKTLVFLATYNERANIEQLLEAILALPVQCNVLVVDDNSRDGTGDFVKSLANPRVTLLARAGRLGIGSAHRLGWLHARRFGYDRLVTLDADLSHDPQDIPRLLAALDSGADAVIGSRFVAGGQLDYEGWRLVLSSGANRFVRRLLRLPIAEYTTSFRAACLDRVPLGLVETIPINGYSFFVTAMVRLARYGLRVTEVPIHFHDRRSGVSKMPKLEILRAALNLGGLFVRQRRFDPGIVDERADPICSQCHGPYRIVLTGGAGTCLRCMNEPN